MMDSNAERHSYFLLILDAMTNGGTLASLRATFNRVARQSSDEQFRIYLAPVRHVLASAMLQNMDDSRKITFPLDVAPYSTLIAYCRAGLAATADLAMPANRGRPGEESQRD
jgi:hypothetical protein